MARGSIYKSDVKKARDALIAEGKHPSLDSVRIALGNTGSKSTIHRLLRELEAEEGAPTGERIGLSDALTDLVQRLAEQLQKEADGTVNDAEARFKDSSIPGRRGDTLAGLRPATNAMIGKDVATITLPYGLAAGFRKKADPDQDVIAIRTKGVP